MSDPRGVQETPGRLESPAVRLAILGAVVLAIVLGLAAPLRSFVRQTDQNSQLAAGLVDQQQRVDQLEQEAQRWRDDSFVEQQARTRLHYIRPGETGYVVIGGEDPAPKDPRVLAPPQQDSPSWYDKLWSGVQEARG